MNSRRFTLADQIKFANFSGDFNPIHVDLVASRRLIYGQPVDDGLGIEEKYQARIFERFYRTDQSRSREIGGSGLGLAIVKHMLEAQNQTITVRSTEGIGSTFGFTLQKA